VESLAQHEFYVRHKVSLTYMFLFLSFLLTTTFFAHRMHDFRYPWAEDGILYLAMFSDLGNVFAPITDAFLLLTNFLAMVAATTNLGAAPIIGSILACCATALLACYVQRSTFDWILPAGRLRYLLALLMLVNVGAGELVGTLIGLSYFCALALVFLMLERPLSSGLAWYVCWVFLCFSSNLTYLVMPIPLALFFLARERRFLIIALGPFLVFVLTLLLTRNSNCLNCQFSAFSFASGIESVVSTFVSYWLLVPVLGSPAFVEIVSGWHYSLSVVIAAGMFCVFIGRFFQLDREKKVVVFGLILGSLGYSLAHKVGRPYHHDPFFLAGVYSALRSSFLHLMLAMVGWTILLAQSNKKENAYRGWLLNFMMLQLLLGAVMWRIMLPGSRPAGDWGKFASEISIDSMSNRYDITPGSVAEPTVAIAPVYDTETTLNVPWAMVKCHKSISGHSDFFGFRCVVTGGNGQDLTYSIPAPSGE
jgi:hypothetical protein